jgi:Domain of unknown function (DUF4198)
MKTRLKFKQGAVLAVFACSTALAHAHDTWFERLSADGRLLALGTGNQFPFMDTALAADSLVQAGCSSANGQTEPLLPQAATPASLLLRVPAQAQSCWAQSKAFDIEIVPAKVSAYLHEIAASPEIRAAWADMQSRGLPWRERYVKHARIALGALAGDVTAQAMPLDLLLSSENDQPLRAGGRVQALVLRDGQPLAGQPIELRSELSRFGLWGRSDAQGRVQFTVPLAGRWVLRGTDLRLSEDRADSWDSRFVTLAFDVAPAAFQKGSSFKLNARSSNQAVATTAIDNEPTVSTTRR